MDVRFNLLILLVRLVIIIGYFLWMVLLVIIFETILIINVSMRQLLNNLYVSYVKKAIILLKVFVPRM